MVVKEIIGCYGKVLAPMLLICCQVDYMVTILKPASVIGEYRLQIKKLVIDAKELNGCYRNILAVMVAKIQLSHDLEDAVDPVIIDNWTKTQFQPKSCPNS